MVAVLSDAGLRRSEAAALTRGDVQRWDDGSGRITVIRSKTDIEAQGAVVAITPAAMTALENGPETPILPKLRFSVRRLSMSSWVYTTYYIRYSAG